MIKRLFYENPRYIMFICMVINDALQLSLVTALYVVSYIFRKIHASVCCFLIMTAVLTTRSTPLILAGMALERYLSICFPMHYIHMCSVPCTFLLIFIILILTATPPLTDLLITVVHEPLSLFNTPIFCDHPLLFRHPSIYYKNCVFDGVYLSFVALTLLYTYCKIMLAAQAASTGLASVKRARNTVLLHGLQLLLCMLTFVVPSLQVALISLFPRFSLEIRYIFFLVVYIIPRFLSPVIYGFREHLGEVEQHSDGNYGSLKEAGCSEDNMNSSRRFDSYNEAFTKNFITFVLVFTIICINGAFVYTYFKSKDFQRDPRYVLYIHLVINDMIMLTLSLGLVIATYTGNPGFIPCWIMLVVLITTNRNSPLNLAGMAMERYIAVCLPLHHVQICTVQRAHLLIALIWLVSFIPAFTDIIIILITQPLSVFSKTVLCHASFVYNTPYHVTLSLVVEAVV
nr:odorant receptor 131-2-like [Pseudochaenichthys georgianus]